MWFLIRMGFWFSIVLLVLPLDSGEEDVGPLEAFVAARDAFGDVAGLCERKPDVCSTGLAALGTIAARARESARMAMDMLGDDENETEDETVTAVEAEDMHEQR